ncbi:MAG: hypothetical protein J1E16_00595 [Muribaculaceae bacterium]|nr:hypothetical protein [Muribaculaceae bacterium]
MRKLVYFIAIGALLASCGGNKSSKEENNEDSIVLEEGIAEVGETTTGESSPQEDEETEGYQPPFSVTAVLTTQGGDKIPNDSKILEDGIHYYSRKTIILEIFKNGKYKGQITDESFNHRTGYRWWKNTQNEFNGNWNTLERRAGEGYQKVYELHWDSNSIYVPDDCEYIYLDDWFDCRDFNTRSQNAWPITNVVKQTGIIKADVIEDDGTPGPELWGETYEGEGGGKLWKFEFSNETKNVQIYSKPQNDPNQKWNWTFGESYTYEGKTIKISDQFKGSVSSDGNTITLKDGFGDVFKLKKVN